MLSPIDESLVRGKKWTALIRSLRAEGIYTFDLESFRDIYTISSTVARLNTEPGADRRYNTHGDKQNARISIHVTKLEVGV